MGILLVTIGVFIIIVSIVFLKSGIGYANKSMKNRISRAMPWVGGWLIASVVVYGLFTIITIATSYNSYLDARTYYDNIISQYRGAITLYEDKSITLDMEAAAKHTFTDLRFQGYQAKMADFIIALRGAIIGYNRLIIKKSLMDKNFFYGWYIIPPDKDMKTIDIIDK